MKTHQISVEHSLYMLAHFIRIPDIYKRVREHVRETDFFDAEHAEVWVQAGKCYEEFGEPPNQEFLTLNLYLTHLMTKLGEKGINLLMERVYSLPLTNIDRFTPQALAWIELIRREQYLRSISPSTPTSVIIDDLNNLKSSIACMSGKDFMDPFNVLTGLSKMDVVPLGIKGFDRRIVCGGVPKKRAVLLLSGTSGGKTTFLTNISVNAAKLRMHSLFFTLEDPEEELATRFYACAAQIPHRRLLFIDERTKEDTESLNDLRKDFEHFIHIYDAEKNIEAAGGTYNGFTADDIEQGVADFVRSGKTLDIVLVDYFNLISGDMNLPESERAKDVTSKLKRIGRRFNVVVVVTAQTNRGGLLKSVVGIEDMAGFFSASWGFDYVMGFGEAEEQLLQKNAMENFDFSKPEEPKKLLVNIAKGKMMAKQKFHVYADFAYMTIKDADQVDCEANY